MKSIFSKFAYTLTISIFSLFMVSCGGSGDEANNEGTKNDSIIPIVQNMEVQRQVGYLKFDSAELVELDPELRNYYLNIINNTNYASGISIANLMEEANANLNRLMESDTGAVYEKDMINAMMMMKGNQRVAAKNLNQAGRWLLRKYHEIQTANYPSLAGQVSTLKGHLSEIRPNESLMGQEKKVRAFIDQTFILLYLMEEESEKLETGD